MDRYLLSKPKLSKDADRPLRIGSSSDEDNAKEQSTSKCKGKAVKSIEEIVSSNVAALPIITEEPSTSSGQGRKEKEVIVDPATNPFPYVKDYFAFIGKDGQKEKSYKFQCKLCSPKVVNLLVNQRSMFNLKKHLGRVHKAQQNDVLKIMEHKRKSTSMDFFYPDGSKKQKTEEGYGVSQIQLDNLICNVFIENLFQLRVS